MRGGVRRGHGRLIFDEVAEVAVFFLADRGLQGHGLLRNLDDFADLLGGDAHFGGDFFGGGLAALFLQQPARDAHELVDRLNHVHRDANGARLVGDGTGYGLSNPPGGVGAELVAAPVVELLDGANQPDVAFLDEIEERHAAADVFLGDADDKPQIGLDQALAGSHAAGFHLLGQVDLFGGGEKIHSTDFAQVHAHRVV